MTNLTPDTGKIVIVMGFVVTSFPAIWRTGAREAVTSRITIKLYVVLASTPCMMQVWREPRSNLFS